LMLAEIKQVNKVSDKVAPAKLQQVMQQLAVTGAAGAVLAELLVSTHVRRVKQPQEAATLLRQVALSDKGAQDQPVTVLVLLAMPLRGTRSGRTLCALSPLFQYTDKAQMAAAADRLVSTSDGQEVINAGQQQGHAVYAVARSCLQLRLTSVGRDDTTEAACIRIALAAHYQAYLLAVKHSVSKAAAAAGTHRLEQLSDARAQLQHATRLCAQARGQQAAADLPEVKAAGTAVLAAQQLLQMGADGVAAVTIVKSAAAGDDVTDALASIKPQDTACSTTAADLCIAAACAAVREALVKTAHSHPALLTALRRWVMTALGADALPDAIEAGTDAALDSLRRSISRLHLTMEQGQQLTAKAMELRASFLAHVPVAQAEALVAARSQSAAAQLPPALVSQHPGLATNPSPCTLVATYPPASSQVLLQPPGEGVQYVHACQAESGGVMLAPDMTARLTTTFGLQGGRAMPAVVDTAANDQQKQGKDRRGQPFMQPSKECIQQGRTASAIHVARAAAVPGCVTLITGQGQLQALQDGCPEDIVIFCVSEDAALMAAMDEAIIVAGGQLRALGPADRLLLVVQCTAGSAGQLLLHASLAATCYHPSAGSVGGQLGSTDVGTVGVMQRLQVLVGDGTTRHPSEAAIKQLGEARVRESKQRAGACWCRFIGA
jgi:hypothetical protein